MECLYVRSDYMRDYGIPAATVFALIQLDCIFLGVCDLTYKEFSEILHSNPRAISKAIKKLESEKLIEKVAKSTYVCEIESLNEYLENEEK